MVDYPLVHPQLSPRPHLRGLLLVLRSLGEGGLGELPACTSSHGFVKKNIRQVRCLIYFSPIKHFAVYKRKRQRTLLTMILSHHDPETPAVLDARIREFGRMWKRGEIGDATFLRSLFIAGYLPDEAQTELNLLKLERR